MCIFRKVLQNTFIPWRPAVPLEWLFLRLRFGVTFALFSGCGLIQDRLAGNMPAVPRTVLSNRSFLFCEEHPAPAKVERIQEEIRHYRFPPLAVRCEKELLEAEDAEEMRELLFRALSSLETFADLLELMNPEAKVEGVDAYAGPGIAAYRQIGVQNPRRLQHRGACGSIARPRQYKLPNG